MRILAKILVGGYKCSNVPKSHYKECPCLQKQIDIEMVLPECEVIGCTEEEINASQDLQNMNSFSYSGLTSLHLFSGFVFQGIS